MRHKQKFAPLVARHNNDSDFLFFGVAEIYFSAGFNDKVVLLRLIVDAFFFKQRFYYSLFFVSLSANDGERRKHRIIIFCRRVFCWQRNT